MFKCMYEFVITNKYDDWKKKTIGILIKMRIDWAWDISKNEM